MSADGSTSPVKADSGATTPAPAAKEMPKFTEREEALLKVAWFCLKSGAPEVDFEKLMKMGNFKTLKTCQNTWGAIKKKLNTMAPPAAEGEEGNGGATPKPKATPKKRTKKASSEDAAEGEDAEATTGSPKKKARATPKKAPKAKVNAEAEEDAEMGEGEVKAEGEE